MCRLGTDIDSDDLDSGGEDDHASSSSAGSSSPSSSPPTALHDDKNSDHSELVEGSSAEPAPSTSDQELTTAASSNGEGVVKEESTSGEMEDKCPKESLAETGADDQSSSSCNQEVGTGGRGRGEPERVQ